MTRANLTHELFLVLMKNIRLTQEQLILMVKWREQELKQPNSFPYNPLVETICVYQKEAVIARMVTVMRENFSRNTSAFMSNIGQTQLHSFEASLMESARRSVIPFVNTTAFYIAAQYAIIHGSLKTGFEEVFAGLWFRTRYIRRDRLTDLPRVPRYRLAIAFPENYFTDKDLVEWHPYWYPRVHFVTESGEKREPASETEKQILLGLNNPMEEYAAHTTKPLHEWSWGECVMALELISSTQAIARLTYCFPNWIIEQSDNIMSKHLFRLRVEQRNVYKFAQRAFHRSMYQNTPAYRKILFEGRNPPFKI